MEITPEEAKDYILYQVGALKAFCDAAGLELQHVKPHGEFYQMPWRDEAVSLRPGGGTPGADLSSTPPDRSHSRPWSSWSTSIEPPRRRTWCSLRSMFPMIWTSCESTLRHSQRSGEPILGAQTFSGEATIGSWQVPRRFSRFLPR